MHVALGFVHVAKKLPVCPGSLVDDPVTFCHSLEKPCQFIGGDFGDLTESCLKTKPDSLGGLEFFLKKSGGDGWRSGGTGSGLSRSGR